MFCLPGLIFQLRVRNVPLQGEMSVKGAVSSLSFMSNYILACCSFSNHKQKGNRSSSRKQVSPEVSCGMSCGNGASSLPTEYPRQKKRRQSASMKPTAAAKVAMEVGYVIDGSEGLFRLEFIDVLAGKVVSLIDSLPFRKHRGKFECCSLVGL